LLAQLKQRNDFEKAAQLRNIGDHFSDLNGAIRFYKTMNLIDLHDSHRSLQYRFAEFNGLLMDCVEREKFRFLQSIKNGNIAEEIFACSHYVLELFEHRVTIAELENIRPYLEKYVAGLTDEMLRHNAKVTKDMQRNGFSSPESMGFHILNKNQSPLERYIGGLDLRRQFPITMTYKLLGIIKRRLEEAAATSVKTSVSVSATVAAAAAAAVTPASAPVAVTAVANATPASTTEDIQRSNLQAVSLFSNNAASSAATQSANPPAPTRHHRHHKHRHKHHHKHSNKRP
jgi:hypothetical protein